MSLKDFRDAVKNDWQSQDTISETEVPMPTMPIDSTDQAGELSEPHERADLTSPSYAFSVGKSYTRADVFRIIGMAAAPVGGPWFTGYVAHGADWFVFCGVGTAGRTGHDYGNQFDGEQLIWYAKTNTNVRQASIQGLIRPEGSIYVFFREGDRAPFTFAGLGTAVEAFDQTPVKIVWALRGVGGERLPTRLPEEIDPDEIKTVFEGARRSVQVTVYERDPSARRTCIERWGCTCVVCAFDFSERYGELGHGFIHVHHLKPLGEVREGYQLDPVADLRPVCPNCHAMLHRRTPALSIEELAQVLRD